MPDVCLAGFTGWMEPERPGVRRGLDTLRFDEPA